MWTWSTRSEPRPLDRSFIKADLPQHVPHHHSTQDSDDFLTRFATRTNETAGRHPLDQKTVIGPIITRAAVKLIDQRVK